RAAGYLLCRVSDQTAKFGAVILAAVADIVAQEAIGHEVHFDGSASSAVRDVGNEIGHAQTAVAGVGRFPTHSQLAKDHDDHPLHDLAASMAVHAVGAVYDVVDDLWD